MNNKLFNPDYLKHLCQKYGFRPARNYGQNFLINPDPVEKIIESALLKKGDIAVEVGPGFGALSHALAERIKKVVAFEIEKKIISYWDENKPANLEIIWGNVLKNNNFPTNHYKVVANLPYQITSAVIRHFLESENPPELMALMVQKEVAERICAQKGEMSLLSVAVQYYAEPEIFAIVPRSYFWPEPKVDSAIIRISNIRRGPRNINEDKKFFQLVKIAFANKRKLLIKNLEALTGKKNKDKLKKVFAGLGLQETVRAQELGVEDWKQLMLFFKNG